MAGVVPRMMPRVGGSRVRPWVRRTRVRVGEVSQEAERRPRDGRHINCDVHCVF
jgi:hypothetical protein